MPRYHVETNQGTFEVESDREPTQADIENYLKQTTPDKDSVAARRQRILESPGESAQRIKGGGVGADLLIEAGIPAMAQATTIEAGPWAQSAVGAGSSALGNLIGQGRRIMAGEQEDFSFGQLAQATATGAIPMVGPEANAARVARPIIRGVTEAGKTGLKMAAIGATGEAIKTEIDEGRWPTLGEASRAAAIPGILGAGTSAVAQGAKAIASTGRRVAENAADYGATGTPPTTGMLLPESFSVTENKLAKSTPGGELAIKRDAAYQSFNEGLQGVAPNPQEGAAIFDQASPLLRQISTASKELGKLNEVAQEATDKARRAFGAIQNARREKIAGQIKTVNEEAERLSGEAFNANLSSALDNARELATARVAGGAEGVDPATARNLFVEHVAKPVEAAFEERSAQLYSGVDNQAATFNSAPILAHADKLAAEVTGGLPKKVDRAIGIVKGVLGEGNVSLQALRNARAELLRGVRLGEFGSDAEERLVKGIASDITKQIDTQAVTALGEEGGQALRTANKFYRETRPLFDEKGVEVLFSSKPGDEYVRQVLAGMEKSGVNSDEYNNLKNLIVKIGDFNPELADAAKGHVNDLLKRSVLFDASRINPNSPAGQLMVDGEALVGSLNKLGKVPGTLEQLGLGSPAKVAELQTLMKKYPEATKMSSGEWDQLFSSPAFRDKATNLSSQIEPIMADAQANALLLRSANLKAAGKLEAAKKAYDSAISTVDQVHGDVRAAQDHYEKLLKDPVAIVFNNPNIADSDFNAFARSLFDPKASKTTNADVRAIADSLGNSTPQNKELLLRLQERYIADKIAAYHSTPVSSSMLKHPDAGAVDLFFNPVNPGDSTNEIARARALLSPAQLNQLNAFARTAKAIGRYEKLGIIEQKPGSFDVPVVGVVRRALDAVADLYREGKYTIAAKLLADPSKFSRIAMKVGDVAEDIEDPLLAGSLGVGRAVSNEKSRSEKR
jgi:hypothetical protein